MTDCNQLVVGLVNENPGLDELLLFKRCISFALENEICMFDLVCSLLASLSLTGRLHLLEQKASLNENENLLLFGGVLSFSSSGNIQKKFISDYMKNCDFQTFSLLIVKHKCLLTIPETISIFREYITETPSILSHLRSFDRAYTCLLASIYPFCCPHETSLPSHCIDETLLLSHWTEFGEYFDILCEVQEPPQSGVFAFLPMSNCLSLLFKAKDDPSLATLLAALCHALPLHPSFTPETALYLLECNLSPPAAHIKYFSDLLPEDFTLSSSIPALFLPLLSSMKTSKETESNHTYFLQHLQLFPEDDDNGSSVLKEQVFHADSLERTISAKLISPILLSSSPSLFSRTHCAVTQAIHSLIIQENNRSISTLFAHKLNALSPLSQRFVLRALVNTLCFFSPSHVKSPAFSKSRLRSQNKSDVPTANVFFYQYLRAKRQTLSSRLAAREEEEDDVYFSPSASPLSLHPPHTSPLHPPSLLPVSSSSSSSVSIIFLLKHTVFLDKLKDAFSQLATLNLLRIFFESLADRLTASSPEDLQELVRVLPQHFDKDEGVSASSLLTALVLLSLSGGFPSDTLVDLLSLLHLPLLSAIDIVLSLIDINNVRYSHHSQCLLLLPVVTHCYSTVPKLATAHSRSIAARFLLLSCYGRVRDGLFSFKHEGTSPWERPVTQLSYEHFLFCISSVIDSQKNLFLGPLSLSSLFAAFCVCNASKKGGSSGPCPLAAQLLAVFQTLTSASHQRPSVDCKEVLSAVFTLFHEELTLLSSEHHSPLSLPWVLSAFPSVCTLYMAAANPPTPTPTPLPTLRASSSQQHLPLHDSLSTILLDCLTFMKAYPISLSLSLQPSLPVSAGVGFFECSTAGVAVLLMVVLLQHCSSLLQSPHSRGLGERAVLRMVRISGNLLHSVRKSIKADATGGKKDPPTRTLLPFLHPHSLYLLTLAILEPLSQTTTPFPQPLSNSYDKDCGAEPLDEWWAKAVRVKGLMAPFPSVISPHTPHPFAAHEWAVRGLRESPAVATAVLAQSPFPQLFNSIARIHLPAPSSPAPASPPARQGGSCLLSLLSIFLSLLVSHSETKHWLVEAISPHSANYKTVRTSLRLLAHCLQFCSLFSDEQVLSLAILDRLSHLPGFVRELQDLPLLSLLLKIASQVKSADLSFPQMETIEKSVLLVNTLLDHCQNKVGVISHVMSSSGEKGISTLLHNALLTPRLLPHPNDADSPAGPVLPTYSLTHAATALSALLKAVQCEKQLAKDLLLPEKEEEEGRNGFDSVTFFEVLNNIVHAPPETRTDFVCSAPTAATLLTLWRLAAQAAGPRFLQTFASSFHYIGGPMLAIFLKLVISPNPRFICNLSASNGIVTLTEKLVVFLRAAIVFPKVSALLSKSNFHIIFREYLDSLPKLKVTLNSSLQRAAETLITRITK